MAADFVSVDQAFAALADPSSPAWGEAFGFLVSHPDTAAMMLETFSETLAQMGVEPSGTDPQTGGPAYQLRDVARAMGIPEADLDTAIEANDR
jgi:hypothetical protein